MPGKVAIDLFPGCNNGSDRYYRFDQKVIFHLESGKTSGDKTFHSVKGSIAPHQIVRQDVVLKATGMKKLKLRDREVEVVARTAETNGYSLSINWEYETRKRYQWSDLRQFQSQVSKWRQDAVTFCLPTIKKLSTTDQQSCSVAREMEFREWSGTVSERYAETRRALAAFRMHTCTDVDVRTRLLANVENALITDLSKPLLTEEVIITFDFAQLVLCMPNDT